MSYQSPNSSEDEVAAAAAKAAERAAINIRSYLTEHQAMLDGGIPVVENTANAPEQLQNISILESIEEAIKSLEQLSTKLREKGEKQ